MGIHHGAMGRLKAERRDEYLALHRAVWPEVLALLRVTGIRDYTIYHRDGWLFATYAYAGDDHDAALARMVADPVMRRWWEVCVPCFETADPTRPWTPMDEVFYME